MTKERASIFADDDALDLSGFAPKAAPELNEVSPDLIRAIAGASHFPSREAKPMGRRPPRIHRTGRTMQFNARTTRKPSKLSMRSPISKVGLSVRRSSVLWARCSGNWRGRVGDNRVSPLGGRLEAV